jgi:hypothetical protein
MRTLSLLLVSAFVVGCAGSPMGIQSAPDAKQVTVGGVAYVVASTGPGTYSATHRDFIANNTIVAPSTYLTRKASFIAAIEAATGCKVTDTAGETGGAVLHASVKC